MTNQLLSDVGSIASILAILITITAFIIKVIKGYKRKVNESNIEFNSQIGRLEKAGTTISARTDLSALVQMTISSLRGTSAFYRFWAVLSALSGVHSLILFFIFWSIGYGGFNIYYVLLSISLGSLAICIVFAVVDIRLYIYVLNYEYRVKKIWENPVFKRAQE